MRPFDLREALRYMGVRGEPSADMLRLAQQGEVLLQSAAQYRFRCVRLPLRWNAGQPVMGELPLRGQSIRAHLAECDEVLALCGTLGSGVDQLIRREMLMDPALALAVNGCAAALLEAELDASCAALAQQLRTEGKVLTSRFSPGYGDLPLDLQEPLLRLMEAYRIGLTVNAGTQLQPEKSVTALCGVGANICGERTCGHACSACGKKHCDYRRVTAQEH